jgi:hypothetical protein
MHIIREVGLHTLYVTELDIGLLDMPAVLLRYDPAVRTGREAGWRKISTPLPELEVRISSPYLLRYPDSLKKKHTYFIKIIDVYTVLSHVSDQTWGLE